MKRIVVIYLSLFVFHFSFSQSWGPVGSGINCPDSEIVSGEPISMISSSIYAMCIYGDKLYAGGMFTKAGGFPANNIASWDGDRWDSLGGGIKGWVTALGADYETLVVGGVFNNAGGKYAQNIARWVDTADTKPSWFYYQRGFERGTYGYLSEPGVTRYYDVAVQLVVRYRNETYAIAGTGLSVWDSKKHYWADVKSLVNDTINPSYPLGWGKFDNVLVVYGDKLCLIQHVRELSGEEDNRIFMWDGFSFKRIALDCPKVFDYITCAVSTDSGLYLSGSAVKGRKTDVIVRLNKNGTYKVIDGLPDNSIIYSMVSYHNKLYIAGQFDMIEGEKVNNIACWDGKKWNPVGAGFTRKGNQATVRCLCIYKGYLYAAGKFTYSGNKPVANIARWKL